MRNNAYLAHEVLVIRNVKLSNQSLDGAADVQLTLQQQSICKFFICILSIYNG